MGTRELSPYKIIHIIHALAAFEKSVRTTWNLESVRKFNHSILSLLKSVIYISDKNEPIRLNSLEPERVIPSIPVLLTNRVISRT